MQFRWFLLGLLIATGALASLACQPCVSNDMCGDGVCSGGVCRSGDPINTKKPASGSSGFVGSDGGLLDGGGSTSSGSSSSSSSGGSSGDGGVAGPDASPFGIPVTLVTGLAVNETATKLVMAKSSDANRQVFQTLTLPYVPGTPFDAEVPGDPAGGKCDIVHVIPRLNNYLVACNSSPQAQIKVFNSNSGAVVDFGKTATPNLMSVDLPGMVVFATTLNTGFGAWRFDPIAPIGQVLPNDGLPHVGIGLVENSAHAIQAAVMRGVTPSTTLLQYQSFAGGQFSTPRDLETNQFFNNVDFITSGQFVTGVHQAVVMAESAASKLVIFTGDQITTGATGGMLQAFRTVTNLSLPTPNNIRMKFNKAGTRVYFLSANNQICRVSVVQQAETRCENLPAGCGPLDFATPVGTSPTFVMCGGPSRIQVYPDF